MEPFLVSCALVAAAEMGDKTQLLAFTLASRLCSPLQIIAGIALATLCNHTLAGAVGQVLGASLSRATMLWITGLSFIGFGLWTLHPDSFDGNMNFRGRSAFTITLIAFFLAEMGDKTQLATVALAARYQAPPMVILGTTAGMLIADVPAVWLGGKFAQRIPMHAVRISAAVPFLALGAVTLFGLTREAV
jgi:putative Ca2+/H+ antiporter (TMEM165/GDT1 family)